VPETNRVRYDLFKRLGFSLLNRTESSKHFSEYGPGSSKRGQEDLIKNFNIPLGEYPRRCETQIAKWERLRNELENPDTPLEVKRSIEFGSLIIHSLQTEIPRIVYGNVPMKTFLRIYQSTKRMLR